MPSLAAAGEGEAVGTGEGDAVIAGCISVAEAVGAGEGNGVTVGSSSVAEDEDSGDPTPASPHPTAAMQKAERAMQSSRLLFVM